MPQVRRCADYGPVRISVALLERIEAALNMGAAAPRSVVAPLAARIEAEWNARRTPASNGALVADVKRAEVHDWLSVTDVNTLYRLRGWHRARHGDLTVEAEHLAEARNLLDTVTLIAESQCEQELEWADDDLRDGIAAAIAEGRPCGECEWCVALSLRDEIDDPMDAAGFHGGEYYQAYGRDRS